MCRRRLVVVAAQIYIHTTLERLLKNHQLCAINMTLQLRYAARRTQKSLN